MSSRPRKKSRSTKTAGKRTEQGTRRGSSGKQRLQRLLASAGFGSRRQCEDLIEAGRVEVDGSIVTKLGTTVDPGANKIRVDGVELRRQKLVYYAVNKPVGYVTTNADPQGRSRVIDLVPRSERVFPVGRLDRNSEGLLLLTNDGELAQQLAHPKYGVRKVYRVTVAGKVDGETMKQMRRGIFIAEGRVTVEGARILKSRSRSTELEIVLREGKNREIRRILARLGHKVQHLRRIAVGPLRLGNMPAGAYRPLTKTEIQKLRAAVEQSTEPRTKGRKGKSSPNDSRTASRARPKRKSGKKTGPAADLLPRPGNRPGNRAVIGADGDEPAKRSKKRTAKKKSAGKRSTGRGGGGKKKTKAGRGSAAGRGAKGKPKAKPADQKRKATRKGKRPKR